MLFVLTNLSYFVVLTPAEMIASPAVVVVCKLHFNFMFMGIIWWGMGDYPMSRHIFSLLLEMIQEGKKQYKGVYPRRRECTDSDQSEHNSIPGPAHSNKQTTSKHRSAVSLCKLKFAIIGLQMLKLKLTE